LNEEKINRQIAINLLQKHSDIGNEIVVNILQQYLDNLVKIQNQLLIKYEYKEIYNVMRENINISYLVNN